MICISIIVTMETSYQLLWLSIYYNTHLLETIHVSISTFF